MNSARGGAGYAGDPGAGHSGRGSSGGEGGSWRAAGSTREDAAAPGAGAGARLFEGGLADTTSGALDRADGANGSADRSVAGSVGGWSDGGLTDGPFSDDARGRGSRDAAASDDSTSSGAYLPTFDSNGRCEPHGPLLADVSGHTVIYPKGADWIHSLLMKNGTLYWDVSSHGVMRRTQGSISTDLVTGTGVAFALLVTEKDLYWVPNDRTLMHASLSTIPAFQQDVVLPQLSERGLVTDGTTIYFETKDRTAIRALSVADTVAPDASIETTLIVGSAMTSSTISDGYLFYGDMAVYRVPLAGGTPDMVVGYASSFAVSHDVIYFVRDAILSRQPVGIVDVSARKDLAIGPSYDSQSPYRWKLRNPVVDGDRVYYRQEDGAIAWVKTDGSDCRILAQTESDPSAGTLVVDDRYVYFVMDDTSLHAIPK